MAITWDVKITVIDVITKMVSIVAIRTDDTNPENPKIETYSILNAIIATTEQKLALLDFIWNQHVTASTKQIVIDNIVGNLEIQAKSNLEARE